MSPRRARRVKRFVTAATSREQRLRGRAYPIGFGRVWRVAIEVAASLNGWRVLGTDPRAGEIRAEAIGRLWKRPDDVSVLLSLDDLGMTRVDLVLTPRSRRLGGGPSFRRIRRFLRALDAALQTPPGRRPEECISRFPGARGEADPNRSHESE